jgi:cytochrome c-type biogenesis protein CcmH
MLLLASGIGLMYLRGRATGQAPGEVPLSAEEQARLKDILDP